MTTEEHALQIIAKLSTATNYEQADEILQASEKELNSTFKVVLPFRNARDISCRSGTAL